MSQYIPEARLEEARQIVARGWAEPATCRIVMDPVVAEAIARHVARRLNDLGGESRHRRLRGMDGPRRHRAGGAALVRSVRCTFQLKRGDRDEVGYRSTLFRGAGSGRDAGFPVHKRKMCGTHRHRFDGTAARRKDLPASGRSGLPGRGSTAGTGRQPVTGVTSAMRSVAGAAVSGIIRT